MGIEEMAEAKDRRKHTRIGNDMPLSFPVSILEFTNLNNDVSYGTVVDKSDEGVGFVTDVRLEPGNIIRIQNEDDSFVTAEVRWVGAIEGKYRVGVLIYK
jgi:hypothetical protein